MLQFHMSTLMSITCSISERLNLSLICRMMGLSPVPNAVHWTWTGTITSLVVFMILASSLRGGLAAPRQLQTSSTTVGFDIGASYRPPIIEFNYHGGQVSSIYKVRFFPVRIRVLPFSLNNLLMNPQVMSQVVSSVELISPFFKTTCD